MHSEVPRNKASLNPANCTVVVKGAMLLGHIVGKERIAMDPDKVNAIKEALAGCHITMTLEQLLWLVLRFRKRAEEIVATSPSSRSAGCKRTNRLNHD